MRRVEREPRIIVALDFACIKDAEQLLAKLDPKRCRVKVGKELFTRAGPQLVQRIIGLGFEVFLDLKFHDIPNTVAGACKAAADLGVWMLNVHALGGRRMMDAARAAVPPGVGAPLLIAVTLLTSLDEEDIHAVGLKDGVADNVNRLARLAAASGLDGVVCSGHEAPPLRAALGQDFALVTPGIRPQGARRDDQKRGLTPGQAMRAGADYLVLGRPITAASDPRAALERIQKELDHAQAFIRC
ncbi:MAG TPA: orotidine-5'-phosphate decarboxylase [Gammaproteobacteria bacterium]|nr:orotidine-5'-phosphate decarboxylase [Gammaproteobacteria bacterium]